MKITSNRNFKAGDSDPAMGEIPRALHDETAEHAIGEVPRIGAAALAVALNEMTQGAGEVGANNCGPWVQKYLNGHALEPAEWCAGFVSWCYSASGYAMPFQYTLSALDLRRQFIRSGYHFMLAEKSPAPGDVVFWRRGTGRSWQGHCGMVRECRAGILTTIEGNKGAFPARVRECVYELARMEKLLGFGRVL